jgi:hypothetical protein
MKAFLGAIGLCAGASAVAVLMAVAGGTAGDRQAVSEVASAAPVERALHTSSAIVDEPAAVRLPGDIFAVHPYPDHP